MVVWECVEAMKESGTAKISAAFDAQAFLDSPGIARRVVEHVAQAVIFSQGDPADTVMYLRKGGVQTLGAVRDGQARDRGDARGRGFLR